MTVSAPGSNATSLGDKGLLGLGPYVAAFSVLADRRLNFVQASELSCPGRYSKHIDEW